MILQRFGQDQVKKKRNRGSPAAKPAAAAARYRHPVPGPNDLLALLRQKGVPMTLDALAEPCAGSIPASVDLQALRRRLDELKSSGQVLVNRGW